MMKKTTIVICGGHFSPAFAIIEKLKKNYSYEIQYVGRLKSLEGDTALSLEYIELSKADVVFNSIITARLQRNFSIHTFLSLFKIPVGIAQSFIILLKVKPKIVLSFGGYVALPICLAAYILKIPIITHEQTSILGLSNRIISKFAKVLLLSWPETKKIPSSVKIVVTGNPIRNSIINTRDNGLADFGDKKLPLIYITGGSIGSQSINRIVQKIIPQLVKKYRLIHQCGSADNDRDFRRLLRTKAQLPKSVQVNYKLIKQVPSKDVGVVLKKAKFVIGRSGANTITELIFMEIPAILIPLPWSGDNEQYENARILERYGMARVLNQEGLTSEKLLKEIYRLEKKYTLYKKNANSAINNIPKDATGNIVKLIQSYLGEDGS